MSTISSTGILLVLASVRTCRSTRNSEANRKYLNDTRHESTLSQRVQPEIPNPKSSKPKHEGPLFAEYGVFEKWRKSAKGNGINPYRFLNEAVQTPFTNSGEPFMKSRLNSYTSYYRSLNHYLHLFLRVSCYACTYYTTKRIPTLEVLDLLERTNSNSNPYRTKPYTCKLTSQAPS